MLVDASFDTHQNGAPQRTKKMNFERNFRWEMRFIRSRLLAPIAWLMSARVPKDAGFGRFAEHAPSARGAVIDNLLLTTGETPMPMPQQILHACACIADSEREENSISTRVDAAIQAIAFLNPTSLETTEIQRYLLLKYERPLEQSELLGYHAYTLGLAKKLLSKMDHI